MNKKKKQKRRKREKPHINKKECSRRYWAKL